MTFKIFSSSTNQLVWLTRLRWAAIAGQLLIIATADHFFDGQVPVFLLWLSICIVTVSNLAIQFFRVHNLKFQREIIGAILIFDTIVLTYQLGLVGGPANPFSIVYIVHVSIASLLLGAVWTWGMVILCSLCFGALFFFHLPFPEFDHHHAVGAFSTHLYGMYFAFVLVSILSGFFLSKMADAIRKSEKDISDLMIVSANQEKLAALTRLSAGAAHELGSPMGTIAIVASELKRQMAGGHTTQRMVEDVDLISSELSRCRLILDKMSCRAGELVGELPELIGADDLRESIQSELRLEMIQQVKFHLPSGFLVKTHRQALIQSLVSLIRNGIDAINDGGTVALKASFSGGLVEFCIEDNGIGIDEAHINKLGEPFFTTKEPGKGMGLGIFLVKLFAKRIGGRLTFNSQPGFGTKAFLILPAAV